MKYVVFGVLLVISIIETALLGPMLTLLINASALIGFITVTWRSASQREKHLAKASEVMMKERRGAPPCPPPAGPAPSNL